MAVTSGDPGPFLFQASQSATGNGLQVLFVIEDVDDNHVRYWHQHIMRTFPRCKTTELELLYAPPWSMPLGFLQGFADNKNEGFDSARTTWTMKYGALQAPTSHDMSTSSDKNTCFRPTACISSSWYNLLGPLRTLH